MRRGNLIGTGISAYLSIAVAGLIHLLCGAVALAQDAPISDCDVYAASNFDLQRKGTGLPFDKVEPKRAIPACTEALARNPNTPRLQFQLGRAYQKSGEYEKAIELFRSAADAGYVIAQAAIGTFFERGLGVPKDEAHAVVWFRKAADQGLPFAQFALGIVYLNGRGVAKDDAQAIIWLRKAAEQGHDAAQNSLGLMYENGRGVGKDDAQAVAWYRKSADQGNAVAQHNLGLMYANGRGVAKDDVQAAAWYRKSAEQGHANAQNSLGFIYDQGRGVAKDDAQAVVWFRKAADQGNAIAQHNLGLMYANGRGVAKDDAQAVAWYRKSAEQGYANAQNSLGVMYENGRGVAKDDAQAVAWYRKAAEQGHDKAKEALARRATFAETREPKTKSDTKLQIDKVIREVSGWVVGFSNGLGGCLASGSYTGGTTVWIGFVEDRNRTYIAFTNPTWQSIQSDSQYEIQLITRRKKWTGKVFGFQRNNEKGVSIVGLKGEFIEDLANSGGVRVVLNRKPVASLSLAGSRQALEETFQCQKAYIEASARPGGHGKSQEKEGSTGTGFFISPDGNIVTNSHVIESCRDIKVVSIGSPAVPARVVARDKTNDLAILKAQTTSVAVPALRTQTRLGESIFVYGFPLSGVLSSSGNFTAGAITATSGVGDDTRMFQISAPVQPGNSGGPLIDKYGNVVGVIVSKLNALGVAAVTKDIPQNVNFAIKSSIATNFLDSNNLAPRSSAKTQELSPEAIADLAKTFTVQVICD